ncbi:MAG: thioredoxin family protein [Gammaproteobacteria bacterium]|nr:thioredoxin family protein [Gammaproteobacteria bacterium]
MVSLETPVCEFGKKAIDFSLPNVDQQLWTLDKCKGEKGLLIMFISNHCPYVKAIRKKLVRDTRELMGFGVNSVAIMPNDTVAYPEDSVENMLKISQEFEFPFPYLLDETQEVARAYDAVCTPDFFGYNADLELQYRGRLDAAGPKSEDDTQRRELFEAMKQVAETGKGPEHQIPSMGCSIKWRMDE